MSEQPNCAEILIGMRYRDGSLMGTNQDAFSLFIGGKMVSIGRVFGSRSHVDSCRNYAESYAQLMNERGVKNYTIVNGVRIRMTDEERTPCLPMSQEGINEFKKTLDTGLSVS